MEVDIKQDPESFTPSGGFADDDIYEDTGELNMPSTEIAQEMWLTRVPKWLWESLATAGEDDEIEIGKLAIWKNARDEKGNPITLTKMFLSQEHKGVQDLPRQYELIKAKTDPDNTYIFTEKDLPGYKPNAYGRLRAGMGGAADGQDQRSGQYRVQKSKSRFRKAIPKHTTLIGAATREYNCIPVPNQEFKNFMEKRTRKAIQGENASTILISGKVDHRELDKAQKAFSGFIRTNQSNKHRQENKAARIAKNDLLDMLQVMFDRYEFWPMKEIKKETKQPEAYLKETLSDIADLVKSGPFASCWRRHPHLNKSNITAVHGKPPDVGGDAEDEVGADEDDGNLEMEDVM
ncbi:hypothetical protein K432DRAFT_384283 [Lepidopterella palustris CBS 459.81]|uniref:Transcription initiation factor IIF subunit beta n=1 Tax=Lepidopterella palustris CBS 459.81 TaxID=1314670 RepID=A0A8E2E660_9PEZI|nr:hypothetical protein K432DRAFT_384283 [Lepidopterella palustris CBS 459.81]